MAMKRSKRTTGKAKKVSAPEPGPATGPLISPERISARAFELFLARGGEPGRDLDDWVQAEAELRGDKNPG